MRRAVCIDVAGCQDHLERQLDRLYEVERQDHLERRFNRSERRVAGVSHASPAKGPGRERIADLLRR